MMVKRYTRNPIQWRYRLYHCWRYVQCGLISASDIAGVRGTVCRDIRDSCPPIRWPSPDVGARRCGSTIKHRQIASQPGHLTATLDAARCSASCHRNSSQNMDCNSSSPQLNFLESFPQPTQHPQLWPQHQTLLDFHSQLLRSWRVAQVEEDQVLLGGATAGRTMQLVWKYIIQFLCQSKSLWEHPYGTCDSIIKSGCMNDIIKTWGSRNIVALDDWLIFRCSDPSD